MRFAVGISASLDAYTASQEACRQVLRQLGGAKCNMVFLFVSTAYRAKWNELLMGIYEKLSPHALIGCSGGGIIGKDKELEDSPAISLVAAHLPYVKLFPFVATPKMLEHSSPGGFWIDTIGAMPKDSPNMVLCADPYTSDAQGLINELNATYPGRPIVGGLVSGADHPGEHLLFCGTDVYREGAVGLAMTGQLEMEAIVSQGCRPIGKPQIITKAEGQVIYELGGRKALTALHDVLTSISSNDRKLAQHGAIFVGVVIDEMRHKFGAGDFLIRNIAGIDPDQGVIAVAEEVKVGETIQFHLRDASTSRDELRNLLLKEGLSAGMSPPAGALMFNCLGRGKSLYGIANHDVKTIQTVIGKFPIGGFFCNGEIGPVSGINFLHGYTASLGLFRPIKPKRYPQPASKKSE